MAIIILRILFYTRFFILNLTGKTFITLGGIASEKNLIRMRVKPVQLQDVY